MSGQIKLNRNISFNATTSLNNTGTNSFHTMNNTSKILCFFY